MSDGINDLPPSVHCASQALTQAVLITFDGMREPTLPNIDEHARWD
jgi:hypothetical protein